jgi:3D (Asp-Asp-Asp) domain-containing protein
VKEGAYISVPLDTRLRDSKEINIKNPKNYTISVGGMLAEVNSIHNKVEDILNDVGIELEGEDYTYPELSAKVNPNSTIEIYRVKEVVEIEESIIPFEKHVEKNNRLEVGISKVVQEGKDGLKRSHIKREYVNGVLTSSEVVKDEIVTEPIPQITEKGSKDFIVTSRGNTRYRKAVVMTATAYDLSLESTGKGPGDKYYGLTASGTRVRPGVVAVDPRVIPLGTKLYVQSLDHTKDYGFAIAEDTGGAIKGNKIDLFFESSNDVYNFGRRKVKVYVLE